MAATGQPGEPGAWEPGGVPHGAHEARTAALAAAGERREAAAESFHLALLGGADVL
jgi:hypothetical protein